MEACVLVLVIFVFSNFNLVNAKQNINKLEIKRANVEEKSEYFEMNLNIPIINGLENKEREKELNEGFKNKALDFGKGIKAMAEEDFKESKKEGYDVKIYEAVVNFNIQYIGENYISLLVDSYSYTGGAHGITLRQSYNIDRNTGEIITLKNIFKDGYDYKKVIDEMIMKQINKDKDNYFPEDFKGIQENQAFFINEEGLVVYFQLYEIAPYVTGFPEFKVPFDDIKNSMKLNIK